MTTVATVLEAADRGLEKSLERLFDLLRIPSLSADPAYHADCEKSARWLVVELTALGFEAEARETGGKPIVVAKYRPPGGDKLPHYLFYGHYDVQPADPLELWHTPPFEPRRATGDDAVERIYARGAADDKGQLMTFVEAARAWITAAGKLPFRATFLIEGEEESGSPSLVPFLEKYREELSCDAAFICDTNMWDAKTPAITTRLRGLVADEITITGPRIDLHSGAYGGPAMNPIRVLTKVIASLHDKTGKVAIKGFYDGVKPLPAALKKQWGALKFSDKKFLGEVGLSIPAGEKGKSALEQVWSRPTAEINGIWGGYTGAGTKTVLPAKAQAKITFRLVGQQDPDKVIAAFRAHVKKLIPKDCGVAFSGHARGAPASELAEDSAMIKKTAAALKQEWGRETVLMGCGGSIPIVRYFKDILNVDSILVGFGLADDAIHSPNEKYNMASYHRGIRSWIRIMSAIAE